MVRGLSLGEPLKVYRCVPNVSDPRASWRAAIRSERQPRVYQEAYVYRFPARAALSLPAGATSICTSPASPDGDACSVRLERGLFIK